jgi:hypothetical protein
MNRAQKRKLKKQSKENQLLAEQITLFEKLPTNCNVCEKSFDKADKKMVSSWKVVVKEKEQIVRLFCPDCHELATKVVNDAS